MRKFESVSGLSSTKSCFCLRKALRGRYSVSNLLQGKILRYLTVSDLKCANYEKLCLDHIGGKVPTKVKNCLSVKPTKYFFDIHGIIDTL